MTYGYARVSTLDQNLDRQLMQLRQYVADERFIITDKASGKDFNRKGYNTLVGTADTAPILHEGDLLVIVSLDRLGRNYTEIRRRFIADLVLQILSYSAEKERENIRKRQRQGIESAKVSGKHLGRPQACFPEQWNEVYKEWKSGCITATRAMEQLNLKRTIFYKLVKGYEAENVSP